DTLKETVSFLFLFVLSFAFRQGGFFFPFADVRSLCLFSPQNDKSISAERHRILRRLMAMDQPVFLEDLYLTDIHCFIPFLCSNRPFLISTVTDGGPDV
ncbi:MAG: hypothetical protein LUC45_04815, partial [Paraprevotella sp.]|nr:hypothetical protein [Paraprevotella sp.]